MKVLHVITGLDAGGAETQLAMLLRHTRNQSDVVTLYNPGPIADRIRDQGTSVRDLGMGRNTELRALLRLYRIIRDGQYDVVHTHLYRAQVYARPAARLAGFDLGEFWERSASQCREKLPRYYATFLASRADISGNSTVPMASPSTPSGNWLIRSA